MFIVLSKYFFPQLSLINQIPYLSSFPQAMGTLVNAILSQYKNKMPNMQFELGLENQLVKELIAIKQINAIKNFNENRNRSFL